MAISQTSAIHTTAPLFNLKDQTGKTVALESLRGTFVVLIFYPGDMTPGCTMQLCAVRDDWTKFEKANAVVYGVNHGGADTHGLFAQKYNFPFPLLIDKDKKISTTYGAVRSLLGFKVIRRTVIVINPSGTIIFYRHGMPKNADILKSISAEQKQSSRTENVT
ncbi:peroxiredoxin [Patescibacteria group bacterium]|nr:peroxiredoxin [Patescibacteria group bacterium]